MDVQTENMDPPPGESQPTGKIRKGFKLFGKRRPGNIFSIRNKGDGNKSPVKSKTLDGLSESTAPDLQQELEKEKRHEVNRGERDQAEEEPLGEDGVIAAAPARTSISSASSAKSLSFLSLIRGGRRGVGDRRAHTVSQPVGRQRHGLKGLFGNVKFRSKDKLDKEESPPSPLLMSSRANSVEIIKEDLTLTPKSQPRSPDSSENESSRSAKILTTQDSAPTSPSKTITPQVGGGSVSRTNENFPPSPTSEPPLIPGDTSLSSLLADISSLLTFDSISGGKDIMADVEAEWGKASSAISSGVSEVAPSFTSLHSKATASSPQTTISVSTAAVVKPSPVAIATAASTQSFTPLTKTTSTSSPVAKPSNVITTVTKSSTLTTPSVKLSLDSTAASATITIKSTPMPTTAQLSTSPDKLGGLSTLTMSSSTTIIKSTSATTTAPPNTPATVIKAPSISPTLTSSASKLASKIAASPPDVDAIPGSGPKDLPVPAQHPASISKDLALSAQIPVSVSKDHPVSLQKPASVSKDSPVPVQIPVSVSKDHPVSLQKPASVSKDPPSSAQIPVSVSKDPLVSVQKQVSVSKDPPVPAQIPVSVSEPPISAQKPASVSKDSPVPAQIPVSVSLQKPASVSKDSPSSAQIPVSVSKDPLVSVQKPVSVSKDPPVQAQVPVSAYKDPPVSVQKPVSAYKDHPDPIHIPVPASNDSPALGQISVPATKSPAMPGQLPGSVPKVPPAFCPVNSLPSDPAPSETSASVKMRGSGQTSVDLQLDISSSTNTEWPQTRLSKSEKLHTESQTSLQGPSRERRTPPVKAPGLSKIPVVGGGRTGKLPVRDNQQADDEASRKPPTPGLEEERPHFNSRDTGSRDKINNAVPTLKHSQEESCPTPQPKVLTSLPRDSKIPVKHSAQSHTPSLIPQGKEPPRTKIPVSKVPVRRVGNKPTAVGGSTQARK